MYAVLVSRNQLYVHHCYVRQGNNSHSMNGTRESYLQNPWKVGQYRCIWEMLHGIGNRCLSTDSRTGINTTPSGTRELHQFCYPHSPSLDMFWQIIFVHIPGICSVGTAGVAEPFHQILPEITAISVITQSLTTWAFRLLFRMCGLWVFAHSHSGGGGAFQRTPLGQFFPEWPVS